MAYNDNNRTTPPYVRETRVENSSGTSMAFIVGGIVVAVAFILWLVFGTGAPDTTGTAPVSSDTTNVTVDPGVDAGAAPAADVPVTDVPATPPADGAVAPPAEGIATPPADGTVAPPADGTTAAPVQN
jgi:hypothetical protein